MLGQLVGARRPTVSTALTELARQGEVARRPDSTWLLTGAPVGVPEPEIERVIPLRRRLLPPEPAPTIVAPIQEGPPAPVHVRGVELRAVLNRLREQCELQVEEMRDAFTRTTRLAEQGSELRDRCRQTRAAAHTPAGGPPVKA
jgi:mRNA-degrading endonuclease toxin of MazEF toxin-antitoxin module